MPVTRTFDIETPAEFEGKAREAAPTFVPDLAGNAFHVRFHRRGFKGHSPVSRKSGSSTHPD
jgi:hypothetical protein